MWFVVELQAKRAPVLTLGQPSCGQGVYGLILNCKLGEQMATVGWENRMQEIGGPGHYMARL